MRDGRSFLSKDYDLSPLFQDCKECLGAPQSQS
jgi:hypothetical protein